MKVGAYLFFEGRCDEAIEFYRKALGAEVAMLMRYKESPEGKCEAGTEDKVMHASLRIGDSSVMVSDGRCSGKGAFQGFGLTISLKDEAQARRMFDALSKEGQVQQPLAKTFFSPGFGMVTDRFGVLWMVIVE